MRICIVNYCITNSIGIATGCSVVLLSRSAISLLFQRRRNTCHVPKPKVLTGMINKNSFFACPPPLFGLRDVLDRSLVNTTVVGH